MRRKNMRCDFETDLRDKGFEEAKCFKITYDYNPMMSYGVELGLLLILSSFVLVDRVRLSLNYGHQRAYCSSPRCYEYDAPVE
jgi:hypothetical protein